MQVYEAEIRIRRSDPKVLADDYHAVLELLEHRRAERAAALPAPSNVISMGDLTKRGFPKAP